MKPIRLRPITDAEEEAAAAVALQQGTFFECGHCEATLPISSVDQITSVVWVDVRCPSCGRYSALADDFKKR